MKGYGIERRGEHIKFCKTLEEAQMAMNEILALEERLVERGWIDQPAVYREVDSRWWK